MSEVGMALGYKDGRLLGENKTLNELARDDDIEFFAERLKAWFDLFDLMFIYERKQEEMLKKMCEALEEALSFREGAMIVAAALGGSYDSAVDRAKLEECCALLKLIEARKTLRKATLEAAEEDERKENIFKKLFGG